MLAPLERFGSEEPSSVEETVTAGTAGGLSGVTGRVLGLVSLPAFRTPPPPPKELYTSQSVSL